MTPNKQVASLENSQRLLELGVRFKDSLLLYYVNPTAKNFGQPVLVTRDRYRQLSYLKEICPAPTFAEIAEVLPSSIYLKIHYSGDMDFCYFHFTKTTDKRYGASLIFLDDNLGYSVVNESCQLSDTPANAACQMLIWLIENGHIKPEEMK